jgi:hypothetical protein
MTPTRLCDHYACRCARAAELADIADRTGNGRYLVEAIGAHGQQVPCRLEAKPLARPAPRA